MKSCWQIELCCSKPELILGFRLERSLLETIRLSEAHGDAQLPWAVSHPQGAAPAVPTTMPHARDLGCGGLPPILCLWHSVYSPRDSNSFSWCLAQGLLGRKQ